MNLAVTYPHWGFEIIRYSIRQREREGGKREIWETQMRVSHVWMCTSSLDMMNYLYLLEGSPHNISEGATMSMIG